MRYPLIIKDSVAAELFKELETMNEKRDPNARVTMGRYLNDIIEARNKAKATIESAPECIICGRAPRVYGLAFDGSKVYFCIYHSKYSKYFQGYGDIAKTQAIKPDVESPTLPEAADHISEGTQQ